MRWLNWCMFYRISAQLKEKHSINVLLMLCSFVAGMSRSWLHYWKTIKNFWIQIYAGKYKFLLFYTHKISVFVNIILLRVVKKENIERKVKFWVKTDIQTDRRKDLERENR